MRTLRADQRAAMFSAAVLLHAALILAWLAARPPAWPIAADPPPMLARFDPLPVMPPVTVPPDPPRAADAPAGGSSAAAAPRRAVIPDSAPPASFAVRPLVRVPAPPVALAAPVAAWGSAAAVPAGGAGNGGEGTGRGDGGGEGDGRGTGTGTGLRYAKAYWVRQPSPREWKRYWPRDSASRKLAGSTVLGCDVTRSGRTVRCRILSETPEGRGVGAATIAMSRVFRVRAPSANGKALDMPVRIPIAFDVTVLPE